MLLFFASLALAGDPPHVDRIRTAEAGYRGAFDALKVGAGTVEAVCTWSVRWKSALDDSGSNGKAAHAERMVVLSAHVAERYAAGTMAVSDKNTAAYCEAEAKVWLETGR